MNDLSRLVLRWLLLGCLMAGAGTALAAKTYSDNGDGTVTDPTTGLIWMRCAMGQAWEKDTCTGTAGTYWFDAANALTGTVTFAGQSDWRLPSIRELLSIVERSVSHPAIDTSVFPNAPSSYFWTGSPDAYNYRYVTSTYVWVVNFYYGNADDDSRFSDYAVRLVRGEPILGLLDMARPDTDDVAYGDGTVTHTPTGLMWQRCAVGQNWTGNSGTEYYFT